MSGDTLCALEAQDIEAGYGGIVALHGVSLHVGAREIVTVIGPNGAGKTTLLRAISGLVPLRRGRVSLDGSDVTGQSTEALVRRGLVHVPERRQLFADLTVEENLRLGAYTRYRHEPEAVERDFERVLELFPILRERRRQRAGTLSGGEQQMLAIGRGLMSSARVLLLDEPSLGLAPLITRQIFDTIAQLRDQGIAVLLVEQNARQALRVVDRGYVLINGRIVLSGTAEELMASRLVQQVYLGALPESGRELEGVAPDPEQPEM
ncbi:ABC transporter ATP-binding protein [Sphaerobacter thermophilus]|uniref:ABC transporter ATP-binding protein n=1 Tax=Sphaerobacter thermophilus TaxID=2057 RepID=UPI00396D6839